MCDHGVFNCSFFSPLTRKERIILLATSTDHYHHHHHHHRTVVRSDRLISVSSCSVDKSFTRRKLFTNRLLHSAGVSINRLIKLVLTNEDISLRKEQKTVDEQVFDVCLSNQRLSSSSARTTTDWKYEASIDKHFVFTHFFLLLLNNVWSFIVFFALLLLLDHCRIRLRGF